MEKFYLIKDGKVIKTGYAEDLVVWYREGIEKGCIVAKEFAFCTGRNLERNIYLNLSDNENVNK